LETPLNRSTSPDPPSTDETIPAEGSEARSKPLLPLPHSTIRSRENTIHPMLLPSPPLRHVVQKNRLTAQVCVHSNARNPKAWKNRFRKDHPKKYVADAKQHSDISTPPWLLHHD